MIGMSISLTLMQWCWGWYWCWCSRIENKRIEFCRTETLSESGVGYFSPTAEWPLLVPIEMWPRIKVGKDDRDDQDVPV